MKRFITFLLTSLFLMTTGLANLANAELLPTSLLGTGNSFTDVDSYTSYAKAIDWMKNNGIVQGYSDGTFGVDKCVSRVEFLKMLYEVQNVDVENESASFTGSLFKDTVKGAWYIPYVKIAKIRGTVNGYPDGKFRPNQCITRAEGVKIVALAFNNNILPPVPADSNNPDPGSEYEDILSTAWYYPYLNYALGSDTVGRDHTYYLYDYNTGAYNFLPNDSLTRKEAAELFYRSKTIIDHNEDIYITGQSPIIPEPDLFFNRCNRDSAVITKNPDILNALPSDSSMVFGIDHSDTTQINNITSILSAFSKEGTWTDAISAYNQAAEPATQYKEISPVLDADWEVALGLVFSESILEGQVFLAGKFEKADDFEQFFGHTIANDINYTTTCSKSGGITYWTNENDDFYYARYGKIFLLTNKENTRTEAIDRLKNGGGFAFKNNYNNGKLAYAYIDSSIISFLQQGTTSLLGSDISSLIDSMGDLLMSLESDSEGIIISLTGEITDPDNALLKKYIGTSPTIVNKVPAKGMIAYTEDLDFSEILMALEGSDSAYQSDLSSFSSELGVTSDELANLLSSPYAIAMGNSGSFMPNFSFYLKFDSGEKSAAEKLISQFDGYVDEAVQGAGSIGGDLTLQDVTTKVLIDSGLTKVYVDVDKIPATTAEEIALKNSLKKSGLELYYGIMDGDTLVIALHPNFPEYYGKSPLSSDPTYSLAVEKLKGIYGAKLTYVNFTNLVTMTQIFIDLSGDVTDYIASDSELSVIKDIAGLFKYFISSTKITTDSMDSRSYLKIGK